MRIHIPTADLYDDHGESLQIATAIFRDYGGVKTFGGKIATVKVYEDNVLIRQALEQPGEGRVLVVDGAASLHCALLGDMLAALALQNGWAGLIINGCIRDSEAIGQLALGVKALNTNPRKSRKQGLGQRDVPVSFGGVSFTPGHYVYADADGIVVAERPLH